MDTIGEYDMTDLMTLVVNERAEGLSVTAAPVTMLGDSTPMTTTDRTKWERVRSRGHARFIWRSFLSWGVPMCVVQFLGQYLCATLTHQPYAPFQFFPSPVWSFIFDSASWIFFFGYVMGESIWQKHEREFRKADGHAD